MQLAVGGVFNVESQVPQHPSDPHASHMSSGPPTHVPQPPAPTLQKIPEVVTDNNL